MASSLGLPSPGPDDSAALTLDKDRANGTGRPPLFTDNSPSSGFWTLEPYVPSGLKNRGRGKEIIRNAAVPITNACNSFDKYLTLDIDGNEVDIFAVHRDIVKQCGRRPKISPQSNNKILICTESLEESEKLKNLSVIGGASVVCKPHFNLNHSKGIIYAPQLMPYSIEKLQEELKGEGVVRVERMKKKVDGIITPQPGLILTFASCKLPEFVFAAWYRYKVKQYIPRPKRCFYCQDFGHVLSSCRRKESGKKPICVNCGELEHGHCQKDPKCVHCGGTHLSSFSKCDVYVMEQEIQAVRIVEKLSFAEARSKVMSKFIRPGVSFSSVMSNRNTYKKIHRNREFKSNNNSQTNNNKRTLSNESLLVEPPSKLQIHGSHSSSSSSLPKLNVTETTKSVKTLTDANLSVEILPNLSSAHASPEAASASAGALTSLEVVPDVSGQPASLEAASASAGALTSLEVGPDLSGLPAFLEAAAAVVTDPVGIIQGVTTVDVHAPSSPDGDPDNIKSRDSLIPAVKVIPPDTPKGKSNPSTSKLHKSKPQRELNRNPRLQGPRKI